MIKQYGVMTSLLTGAVLMLSGIWLTTPAHAQQKAKATTAPEIVTKPFDDWRVECRLPAANGLKCQMIQQLLHATLKKPVLAITISHSPKEKRDVIQIVLPLGFLIKPGVDLDISTYKTRAGIDRCTVQGCFIEGFAESKMIDMMRRTTKEGSVSFVARNGQKTSIRFSLRGFAGAYTHMRDENLSHIKLSSEPETPKKAKKKTTKKKPRVPKPTKKTVKKKLKKPEVEDVVAAPTEPDPAPIEEEKETGNWFDRKQDDPSL